ncbi:male-specific lethal 3 [Choristoneura fumiferana]|uniref:male-specific lethal 3 n=1 Tax=Choristoneura fumiferana TaxID=7141 RepID=UPI003D157B60
MVSTRGVRYKFSEGERVLCYEPDPTKAKVLYDSKVLEVIESKDKRGRRSVEYLIHFQGWNSSWDRCVSEDFVLKDTEENRQLQRDLAEKSQLQLGAYLYRRERKKCSSASGGGPAKRTRHGFSDDGSSSSTPPDEGETGDTDSSSISGSSSARSPPPLALLGRANITLPSALRDRLTFDYHLVVKRGRLSRLPAAPSAAQVLESFVKWFARAGAWHPARPRHDPPVRPDLLDVSCRLNLVREVADGLRVYFDFVLRAQLLYKQERAQYHDLCGQFLHEEETEEEDIKSEMEEDESAPPEVAQSTAAEAAESAERDIKSPKIPEYSHLPPDPVPLEKTEEDTANTSNTEEQPNNHSPATAATTDEAGGGGSGGGSVSGGGGREPEDAAVDRARDARPATRSGHLARRLRSHKSAVSQSENEEPAPCTSTGEQRTFETLSSSVGSSGSSLSECWARPAQAAAPAAAPTRTPLSQLLDKVAKWQIVPREGTEHLPCRVYGAIHLARLFVKLPDFLNATQMPDFKLKLILKHVDMFIQYLDEHSEWFGEMYYIADNVSRSH